jgi:antitoxin (DNA-binding transcriptional repressor) of toxin-antitoxin stability system
MVQVSVEDIQRDLMAYLQRVEAGETVVIVRAGHPVAEMKPVALGTKTLRPFGLCTGEFTVPEDFDAPLPEDILKAFEGARDSCSIPPCSSGSSVGMGAYPPTGGSIVVIPRMPST